MTDPRNMARTDGGHTSGHNLPDDIDPFVANLEEANEDLILRQGDLEMDAAMLPREAKSDEDVAKIAAWVAKAKTLYRDAEKTREKEKADYLAASKKIDGWFGAIKSAVQTKVEGIEKRCAPYLAAKRAKEEAEAAERARLAKIEQDRLAEVARKAQEEAAAARRAQEAEEERLRQVETDRIAREEAARRQAEEDEVGDVETYEDEVELDDDGESEAAEEAYRQSMIEAQKADEAAQAATLAAEKAAKATDRADRVASGETRLGKVSGAGVSTSIKTTWTARINSYGALIQCLGPLGSYFLEGPVRDAVARAAKAERRPDLPGVEWIAEDNVNTRQTRTKDTTT